MTLRDYYNSLSLKDKSAYPNGFWRAVLTDRGEEFFKTFIHYSREAHRHRDKYGAKAIIERLRWHYMTKGLGRREMFKLNNNYTSAFARVAMKLCPDLNGFFSLRKSMMDVCPSIND